MKYTGPPLLGDIAEWLALQKGLITHEDYKLISIGQHKTIPSAGWTMGGFMDAVGADSDFLDEVIKIQQEVQ